MVSSEATLPSSSSSAAVAVPTGWKERILVPTVLGGAVGAGAGLISKHRNVQGLGSVPVAYATNLAIVTGCYCGAREFVRKTRASQQDDLMNSVIGGAMSGALIGRLQGGQMGAFKYSIIFAVMGTSLDFATLRLTPILHRYKDQVAALDWKLPEWSPIQVLDEEALAKKRAREQQLRAQREL